MDPTTTPHVTFVFEPYTDYGYILVNMLLPAGSSRQITDAGRIEQVMNIQGILGERLRFTSGFWVYRIPARWLNRCQHDVNGYFLAWDRKEYRIVPKDPSPGGCTFGLWQPMP